MAASKTQIKDGSLLFEILKGEHREKWTAEAAGPLLELAGDHGLIAVVYDALLKDSERLFFTQRRKGTKAQRTAEIDGDEGRDGGEWGEVAADLELNSAVQVKAAAELSAGFVAAKVDAVFAKGLALALTVYERPGLRAFVDMDVLIEPEVLKRADAVLRSLGYGLDPQSLKNPIECSYSRERLPGFPVQIDLHWGFTGDDGLQAPVRVSILEILARAVTVKGIRVPALEDTLILAAANLPRKAAQPLMLVVDFAKLLTRAELDWDLVYERAELARVKTALWLGMTLAAMHLNAPVDAEFLKRIEPSEARGRWLLKALEGEKLWSVEKHRQWRYSMLFKLKCLDSAADERRAVAALPKGILRKLGMSQTWSQRELGL